MSDFVMPSLGADMEAGTLLDWYVKPGDTVKRGDIVALVDTSKAEIEVEIFEDGVIDELVVPVGARVPVGTVLATLHPVGAKVAAAVAAAPTEPAPPEPRRAGRRRRRRPRSHAAAGTNHRLRVSPLARRVAEQLGVDLATVTGTGPNGAITRADVERVSTVAVASRRRSRQLRRRPAGPSPPTARPRCARRSAR